jgi:hypothetical protein
MCEYGDVRMCEYADVQICECADLRMYGCANMRMCELRMPEFCIQTKVLKLKVSKK